MPNPDHLKSISMRSKFFKYNLKFEQHIRTASFFVSSFFRKNVKATQFRNLIYIFRWHYME